jgi:hypothetical protein
MAQPTKPYTVSLQYTDADLAGKPETYIALYYWDGYHWVRERTSQVDEKLNRVNAAPDHFSLWALMTESGRVYLPRLRLPR